MGLKDIAVAVAAYRKLSPEERALFHVEAGRRGKRKVKRAKRAPRSRHIAQEDDAVPIRQAIAKPPKKKKAKKAAPRQVVDPLAPEQVAQA